MSDLEELRRLSEAATPGPWKAGSRHVDVRDADWHYDDPGGLGWEIGGADGTILPEPNRGMFARGADAHLVAAAANYVRDLLSNPTSSVSTEGVADLDVERLVRAMVSVMESRDLGGGGIQPIDASAIVREYRRG